MSSIHLKSIGKQKLMVGSLLMITSMLMPMLINVDNFGIYPLLYDALEYNENEYMIYAALKLVALNSLRSMPHYLGAFLVGESFEFWHKEKRIAYARAIIASALVPVAYYLIYRIYGIRYDFGGPAIILILMLIMLGSADLAFVNVAKKALMVLILITAVQVLDVMPWLTNMPFGRGETSSDIKAIAFLLDSDGFLQIITMTLFSLLLASSVLLCKLIIDENNLRELFEYKERSERARNEQRIKAMEARSWMELLHLVHDLKSPLTAAQALVSVVRMCTDEAGETKNSEYLERVETSMGHMNGMISEMLNEDYQVEVCTGVLLDTMLAQISNSNYARILKVENNCPDKSVRVNQVRFIRALVNLIENAYYALDSGGSIALTVYEDQAYRRCNICFEIQDDGRGISSHGLGQVWAGGYSTRGSSGLGLSFVRQVVEQNMGSISLDSTEGVGTTVRLYIPESGDGYELDQDIVNR